MKLAVPTAYGAVEISEDELSRLTNRELATLRISPAVETFDGKWEVHIVRYSSDPFVSFMIERT